MQDEIELFSPEEMRSPFETIKETDAEGREWWNSRKLARLMGYQKYWNFERLMDKVATFLQQEKGLELKEHMVEIEEMAQLNNKGWRQVKSIKLSKAACIAIVTNADQKKPVVKAAKDYFMRDMSSTELATSVEGNVLIYRSSKMNRNKIKLNVDIDRDIVAFARYSTLCQIFVNLFDNSIYWLSFVPENLRNISIKVETSNRIIVFADSGIGVDDAMRPYLFEAGYSMKIPPSGLGLYICKSYMNAMKGTIYETPTFSRMNNICGAQFTIDFSHVPERKENE